MHFSIPDTKECRDLKGSSAVHTEYNIHINGVFHCCLRYSRLHSFNEQLKKEFGSDALPSFPKKKLLSLTQSQLEDRRLMLERYIQIVSQDPQIAGSETFNQFLLSAQQESQNAPSEEVSLDIHLLNGQKVSLRVYSVDQTDDVLEATARSMGLAEDLTYYFALFLVNKEEGTVDYNIVRKLQEFESPYISLLTANNSSANSHRIILRKSYWEDTYDDDIFEDRIAVNLLYVQTVVDIQRGWVMATKEQHKQLGALQKKDSKKEYLRLARTLKFYGHIQFKPCFCDYPSDNCQVIISAGNKELVFRLRTGPDQLKEGSFKVTRMRCWRITPPANAEIGTSGSDMLELSFEYLIAKDTLRWITITSDQAILMSMCLQGMVDELLLKKQNRRIKRPHDRMKTPASKNGAVPSSLPSPTTPTTTSSNKPFLKSRDPVRKVSDLLSVNTQSSGDRRNVHQYNGVSMHNDSFGDFGLNDQIEDKDL